MTLLVLAWHIAGYSLVPESLCHRHFDGWKVFFFAESWFFWCQKIFRNWFSSFWFLNLTSVWTWWNCWHETEMRTVMICNFLGFKTCFSTQISILNGNKETLSNFRGNCNLEKQFPIWNWCHFPVFFSKGLKRDKPDRKLGAFKGYLVQLEQSILLHFLKNWRRKCFVTDLKKYHQ